ncbi:MAG: hypothetical protein IPJ50_00180 [Betaproteobacteria bacterium]|nr:hypothetical protein [Betaproteobacteria bacterium]
MIDPMPNKSVIHSVLWKQALLKGALLFVASYGFAVYLNVATNVWRLIELLPRPVVSGAASFLLVLSAPLQPNEVHEQEQFLELLLVWLFSAPVSIPALVAAYFAVRHFCQFLGHRKNESVGHL